MHRPHDYTLCSGSRVAQNNLTIIFETDDKKFVAQNRAEAIRWYRLSAAQTVNTAIEALKRLRA